MEKLSEPAPAGVPAVARTPIAALTGIRAVAAVWVVLFHFRAELVTLLPALKPLTPFMAAGRLGVDLFFVLSGFILAFNYADRFRTFGAGDYGRFLWLRLARVYPVHLFTLAVLVVTVVGIRAIGMSANPPELYTVPALFTNLLMVNAWTGMELTWNYPAWSISAEWFAYLVFPVVGLGLARLRSTRLAVAGAAAALAAMYGVFVLFPTGPVPAPLVRIGAEFLAGCLLCVAYRRGFGRAWNWPLIAGGGLVAAVGAGTWLEAAGRPSIWAVPAMAVVIPALARADRGVLSRWLATRHMVYLGQASYALYMTHAIGQLALTHVVAPQSVAGASLAVRLCVVFGYAAVLFGAAMVVYRYVEEPSRHWMRRRLPAGSP